MNRILEVCLVAFTLAMNVPSAPAQSPALQKGISVQIAATSNATPMPAADNEDAWIVTIAADGKLYFGADPVDAEDLTNDVKIHPHKRNAKLYIKADARAPFNSVEKVLEIGHNAYFESVVFLTNQNETPAHRKNGCAPRLGGVSHFGAFRRCGCGISQLRPAAAFAED